MEEPFLEPEGIGLTRRTWEESAKIWRVAFPSILCRASLFGILVVTQAFMGHISELDLAAYALIQVIFIGFSNGILLGMSSATQTLCGQAFGAKQNHMLGIYLQRSCIVNLAAATMMAPLFAFAGPIYKLLGQEEAIAREAGKIAVWFIPFLYQNALEMTTQKYLQAHMRNRFVGWVAAVSFVIHLLLSWILVSKLGLGVAGAMGALILSTWLMVGGMLTYVFGGWCPDTWTGFSMAAFVDLGPMMKLSVYSGIMICLEIWFTSILVLIAGYMPDAKTAISSFSICLNIIQWVFMISLAFLAAACVRISNELGRGDVKAVKFAISVVLGTSACIGVLFWIICLVFGRKISYLFTSSEAIAEAVSGLSIFLAFSILLNSVTSVLSGVAIGAGRQSLVAIINLVCYYVIGVPLGFLLAYFADLQIEGIWIGMMSGVATQTLLLGYMTWRTDWDDQVRQASERLKKWLLTS